MIEIGREQAKERNRASSRFRWHGFCTAAAGLLVCASTYGAQAGAAQQNLRQTALALEQQGRNAESEAAWHSYLTLHPSSSEAYANLGLLEARQENYKPAIAYYRKALALHSPIPGLQLNLGLAYFKAGELKEALGQFLPLLKNTPPSPGDRQRLTILIGMGYYGLEQYAQAAPYLKEASSSDPQNLPLLMALAHSYLWSKQYQNVMTTYRQILLLNAESAEADMLAGEALDEMKDAQGAIQQFRAAVKADSKMPDVHFGLGYLLWGKRQYQDAIPELQAELENNPKHAQAMTYLADCNVHLGHPDVAAPLLERAIAIDPGIELAHLDLGSIDADAGRLDDALREFNAAAKLAPNDVDVHWRLGRLYRTMGKKDLAKAELDKARGITQDADRALVNKMNPHAAQAPATPSQGK